VLEHGFTFELTQPGVFVSPREAKRALARFVKRLLHRWPEAAGYWVLEFQRRGAAHFHGLVYGLECEERELRAWVRVAWYECLRSEDPQHLRRGSRLKAVRSVQGAVSYIARHLAKGKQKQRPGLEAVGRWWGHFGRLGLYQSEVVERVVQRQQLAQGRRLMCQLRLSRARAKGNWKAVSYWRHKRGLQRGGFTLLCHHRVMFALEEVTR